MAGAQATVRSGWLARAILSGFVATVLMSITALIAYGVALVLANVTPAPRAGAQQISLWFKGLTANLVVEMAMDSFYAGLAIHFAIGLIWAALYASVAEPRLPGPDIARGITFALVPWLLSLVVFFPVIGAGFFGSQLGAGPLPVLGNFVLHVVYGGTLGLLYGSFGDIVVSGEAQGERERAQEAVVMSRSEHIAARGVVVGLGAGLVLGVVITIVAAMAKTDTVLNLPLAAFVLVSALMGGTVGALVGALLGLAPQQPAT